MSGSNVNDERHPCACWCGSPDQSRCGCGHGLDGVVQVFSTWLCDPCSLEIGEVYRCSQAHVIPCGAAAWSCVACARGDAPG